MKKSRFLKLALIIFFVSSTISAQDNNVLYIKSSRFVSPLVEKWIAEYKKVNPEVQFKLADNKVKAEDIALKLIVSDESESTLDADEQVLLFGRYAILPITKKENPLVNELAKKRLNNKRLKELFFEKDIFSDDPKPSKSDYDITVYSGNNTSIAQSFASFFGYTTASLKGKKISGDDIYLINAIQKDNTGITFNSLGNIFDFGTRKLKDNIVILPLDIKKEYREYFTESSNIDNLIEVLESIPTDLIPINDIGFAYHRGNDSVNKFLAWILSEGKLHNHAYGILNLDEKVLTAQIKKIEEKYYTSLHSK